MAHDIDLVVGFDYDSAQAQALKKIIDEVNAFVGEPKVAKIKFEVEESGLKDLERIQETLNSIGTAGIGINTQGGFQNVVQDTKTLTDNIGEANSTLQQFARIASGINSDKAREIADALRFDGVTDSNFINKVASDLADLSGEVQKVSVKWRDFGENGEYAAAVTVRSVDELGNSFSRTIDYIKTFDDEGEEVWDRQVRGQATLKTEALQTAEAIKNETREMNEFYQVSQSIEALRSKIIGASEWTAALGGSEATKEAYHNIQNLTEELNRLDQAHQNHTASNESVKTSIRGLNVEYQKQANVIKEAGANHKNFWDKMGNITEVLARYFTMYKVFQTTVRTIKNMVNEVVKLDDAMTQLRVVTDNTEAEYSRFSKTVASTAREIGASITDLIDSTTTYARLGYSLEESSELSRYTAMLKNVGKRYCLSA